MPKLEIVIKKETLDYRWLDTKEASYLIDVNLEEFVGKIHAPTRDGKRWCYIKNRYDPQNAVRASDEKTTLSQAKSKLLAKCRYLIRYGYWMKKNENN